MSGELSGELWAGGLGALSEEGLVVLSAEWSAEGQEGVEEGTWGHIPKIQR